MANRINLRLLGAMLLASAPGTAVLAQTDFPNREPRPEACSAVIQQELDRASVPQTRIESISINPIRRDVRGNDNKTVGLRARARLNDCPGSFVVETDRTCRVRQVYTRGMCNVPGVKSFD